MDVVLFRCCNVCSTMYLWYMPRDSIRARKDSQAAGEGTMNMNRYLSMFEGTSGFEDMRLGHFVCCMWLHGIIYVDPSKGFVEQQIAHEALHLALPYRISLALDNLLHERAGQCKWKFKSICIRDCLGCSIFWDTVKGNNRSQAT